MDPVPNKKFGLQSLRIGLHMVTGRYDVWSRVRKWCFDGCVTSSQVAQGNDGRLSAPNGRIERVSMEKERQ